MFTKAIVRQPASNFADGVTRFDMGRPSFELTIAQHQAYCTALETCGLALTHLPADTAYPDSTFVEDVAVITEHGAILTRPGTESRAGEVASMQPTLAKFFADMAQITELGTLDGGDICEAGTHILIGVSHRTNQAGADQLARWLAKNGYTSATIDVREVQSILHLKSGISYIGDNRMVVIDELAQHPELNRFELIPTIAAEDYAANCIRVNDYVLIAAGFPVFEASLKELGYKVIALDMSEYQKMDGGLSCLSLRF